MFCPEGHYVCDSCHKLGSLEALRQVLDTSLSTDPIEIFETVVAHSSVPMHGPEHHAIVPAAIVAASRNAGHPIPEGAIERAIARGVKVPGGWCGLYGACGAAIGVGIGISVLTEATPLTGKERSLAIEATSLALDRLVDGHPRCCKRAGRRSLEVAIEFLRDRLAIALGSKDLVTCTYSERNRECAKASCPYYVGGLWKSMVANSHPA